MLYIVFVVIAVILAVAGVMQLLQAQVFLGLVLLAVAVGSVGVAQRLHKGQDVL